MGNDRTSLTFLYSVLYLTKESKGKLLQKEKENKWKKQKKYFAYYTFYAITY